MVRDIILDIKERDLLMANMSNPTTPVFDSVWGGIFDEDAHIDILICNVIIPEAYWGIVNYNDNEMVFHFASPYIPDVRNFRIRLVAIKDGVYSLFSNVRGNFGIPVYSYATHRNVAAPISASMLPYVDIDGKFTIKLTQNFNSEFLDRAYIYSSKITDLAIGHSDYQASQLLSLCAPGHLYRYPMTGVGISRYINTVIAHTDLREVLEKQFDRDGKPIYNADFDNTTGAIEILCAPEKGVSDTNLNTVTDLDVDFFNMFVDDYVRRNIVLTELSDPDFTLLFNLYERVLHILLFKTDLSNLTRIDHHVSVGRFDSCGNIVEDDAYFIVSATLEPGTIVMFDDENGNLVEDTPVFIVNDYDETRLYTALVEQPYWVSESCHKCFILNKRSTVKYMIQQSQFRNGKGLFVVERSSDNLKNMLAIVHDSHTGRLLGVVSDSTNINDVVLDEVTQHIYISQLSQSKYE